ncbi:MAG TPA: hypothetical protein DEP36_00970, partial [Gammaproteobacteria bacterium]|nr:hypothetical protein [Gammaproteobacteria bacterium]
MTNFNFSELAAAALDALRASGLAPHDAGKDAPVFDGQLHRYRVEGDKAGSKNAYYVLHLDGRAAGVFGSWKSGLRSTWA